MNDISLIDSNFKVETNINEDGICFYDVKQAPFKIYGVFYEGDRFKRLPQKVAETVSEGVYRLHSNTAGGRVRFKTDSPYVAIHAKMPKIGKMPHCALTGSAGFDLYVSEERYVATFIPPFNIENGYESIRHFDSAEMREITINFPLYSDISELYIGLREGSTICEPTPYKIEKPIVYYGSSITQGGCASRPGNSYQSIVSRRLNADYINLGFAGNAKAEDEIAEYISDLEMSAFIYDYDHNAPTLEHLQNTHQKMFKIIRDKNPNLPIVIMSRPKYSLTEADKKRFSVINKTYDDAISQGDKNVYLIDSPSLMRFALDDGTVDGCHPNDLGFDSMAKGLGDILETII